MGIIQKLMDELQFVCNEHNLDFKEIRVEVEPYLDREPIAYMFGHGMPPDNSDTMFDLVILFNNHFLGYDIRQNFKTIGIAPLSSIENIILVQDSKKIKLDVKQKSGFGGFFLNIPLSKYNEVITFHHVIRNLMFGN